MQVLVTAPTREIAVQTRSVVLGIAEAYSPFVACHACIGGLPIEQDYTNLSRCDNPRPFVNPHYASVLACSPRGAGGFASCQCRTARTRHVAHCSGPKSCVRHTDARYTPSPEGMA